MLLWTLTAVGVALWVVKGRDWAALRLVPPQGWRLWAAIGLVLALAIVQSRPVIRIGRSASQKRIKIGSAHAAMLSPHTRPELLWWIALSLSAGFCEEFVFRGYLIWVFQPWLGLWGASALSVVVFALAHAYQGGKGILATGAIGLFLTLVVLGFGSLWPAIVLHALIDIAQGLLAWVVLRRAEADV